MQNLPSDKISPELSRPQLMLGGYLVVSGNVNYHNHYAAWPQAPLGVIEQRLVQIKAHRNQIPRVGFDPVLVALKICQPRVDPCAALPSPPAKDFDGGCRSVDGCHPPAMFGKPDRVATRPAGQIESPPRSQFRSRFNQKRIRRNL